MPVYQHITHRKILCKTDQSIVNGSITVRMVAAQYIANSSRALFIRLVRCNTIFIHGIQNTTMNWFQAVTNIRQGTLHNDGHGISHKGFLYLIFQIHIDNSFVLFILYFIHKGNVLLWGAAPPLLHWLTVAAVIRIENDSDAVSKIQNVHGTLRQFFMGYLMPEKTVPERIAASTSANMPGSTLRSGIISSPSF